MIMKKLANYLWVEKVGEQYVYSMTAELQDDIGTVGYVEFMGNDDIEVDDEIVSIEASKTVLDVQSPLAGKIVERNTKAEDEATILNSEKPEENWLIKLENVDEAAFNALPEAQYVQQQERLSYLIEYLWREAYGEATLDLPESDTAQWEMYRGLANIRPPQPISE